MKELINIYLGQAGTQIGNACWSRFTQQHHILPSGQAQQDLAVDQSASVFFYQTQQGKYVPRTLLIDLDPTPVDQIRVSKYRDLFNPNHLISGKQDAAGNFSRGYYTIGKEHIDRISDQVRKLANQCDNLEGFLIYNSMGGGTGSSLGTLLQEKLSINFDKKKLKVGVKIFSSDGMGSFPVQGYNNVLSLHRMFEDEDMTLAFNNQALYDICSVKLQIQNPSYTDINKLVAKSVSEMTKSMRFGGCLNTDIKDMLTNLVPYPRIKFIVSSYSPFVDSDSQTNNINVADITNQAFEASNQMIKINPQDGKYMACAMHYGGDVLPKESFDAITTLKSKQTIQFVDWCHTGFKVSINRPYNSQGRMKQHKKSCFVLSNTSSFNKIFRETANKFDPMYDQRAFVYWFVGEGMQSGEFSECRQNLAAIEKDYEQVVVSTQSEDGQ